MSYQVLHTNCPEHADFNDYSKCNFRLALPRRPSKRAAAASADARGVEGGEAEEGDEGDGEVVEIGPDTRWSVIERIMGPPKGVCVCVCVCERERVCVCVCVWKLGLILGGL